MRNTGYVRGLSLFDQGLAKQNSKLICIISAIESCFCATCDFCRTAIIFNKECQWQSAVSIEIRSETDLKLVTISYKTGFYGRRKILREWLPWRSMKMPAG